MLIAFSFIIIISIIFFGHFLLEIVFMELECIVLAKILIYKVIQSAAFKVSYIATSIKFAFTVALA
jgi:hypothetical protein